MLALGVVAAGLWAWHAPDAVPFAEPSPPMQPAPTNALVQPVPLAVTPVSATPVARVVAPKATPPAPEPAQAARPVTPLVTTPLLSQLPEDIRRQIPALTITGAVYSDNPAQRLLLVNGQVLSQGSLAAPDLTLEHIGAANSEFSFRGTRFRLAH
jgi:general secretion pathway protein B